MTQRLRRRSATTLGLATLLAAAALGGAAGVPAYASQASSQTAGSVNYATTDDVGERLQPVARPDGNYGMAGNTTFPVACQVESPGQGLGSHNNILYFRTFYRGRNIYIPDYYTNSPHYGSAPPIQGIPMCDSGSGSGGSGGGSTSQGPGAFSNATIADWMLARQGQRLGQCRNAVNTDASAVSGGRFQLGGERYDYNAGFRRVGAYRVTDVNQAVKGDVVQVGSNENYSHLHTYVVVNNHGGGALDVVDSNNNYDEKVTYHARNFNQSGTASQSTIWRLGHV